MRKCAKCGIAFELTDGGACPRCGHLDAPTAGLPAAPADAPVRPSDGPAPGAWDPKHPLLTCPHCAAVFAGIPGDDCPRCGSAAGERPGLPWQDRRSKGHRLPRAWARTWWTVLAHRRTAFIYLRPGRGLLEPLLFQVLTYAFFATLGLAQFWVFTTFRLDRILFQGPGMAMEGFLAIDLLFGVYSYGTLGVCMGLIIESARYLFGARINELSIGFLVTAAATATLVYAAGTLIAALLLNLLLRVRPSERRHPGDTYSVFAYGLGSANLWMLVPFIGGPVGLLWAIQIMVTGIAQVHGTGKGRACLAIFVTGLILAALAVPLVLCLQSI